MERNNFFSYLSQSNNCQLNRFPEMVFAIINSAIGCEILIPCSFFIIRASTIDAKSSKPPMSQYVHQAPEGYLYCLAVICASRNNDYVCVCCKEVAA